MSKKSLQELLNLSGKTAMITGGAMGIGRASAERLHEAGANIVVADLATEEGNTFVQELNHLRDGSAAFVQTDVTQEKSVNDAIATTVETFGGLDILLNDAGIYPLVPLTQMTEADFMKVIDINLRGVFLCTKAAAVQMKEQGRGGKIINITSIDSLHPTGPGLTHYDASKHGVLGFTKAAALELMNDNITVNAIAPSAIATPGSAKISSENEAMRSAAEALVQRIPMHRFGDPDDIAKAVLFLASDMSSYTTGTQLLVDGGLLIA